MSVLDHYISKIPTVEDTIRIRSLDHSSKLSPEDAIKVLNRYIVLNRHPGISLPLDNNKMSAINGQPLFTVALIDHPNDKNKSIEEFIQDNPEPRIYMKRFNFNYYIEGEITHYHQHHLYHYNGSTLTDLKKEFPHLIITEEMRDITINIPGKKC